eukprot:841290-Pyramimonas_sp.AAC.1
MYTPRYRIHKDPLSCANVSAGPEKASVGRVRLLICAGLLLSSYSRTRKLHAHELLELCADLGKK